MKKFLLRFILYLLTFIVFVGGSGLYGFVRAYKEFYGTVYNKPVPALQGKAMPAYDPNKPTVAVVMGDSSTTTEVFDFLIPYNLFSRTGAYNVFAVAPDTNVKSLSGGLEVVPHYSFKETDTLLGRSPDIIVVPYIPVVDKAGYRPVREWLLQHSDALLLSICGGSQNLAEAGLLKGKTATSHWQIIPALVKQYPETKWVSDRRYVVPDDNIVTSAGQTAAIDAILYVISRQLGEPAAAKAAKDIHYPSYPFVHNPKVDPYYLDFRFATYILNNAFQWNKTKAGVLLYDGMDEMALSSIFDTYADTGTTTMFTVSSSERERTVVTGHNLNLVARYPMSGAPKVDKMIVPGAEAKTLAAEGVKRWNERSGNKEPLFMHADAPDRFVFEAPLEDLAGQEDLLTARHAVKRLEYRAGHVRLEGKAVPFETYFYLLLTGAILLLAAIFVDKRFIATRKRSIAA